MSDSDDDVCFACFLPAHAHAHTRLFLCSFYYYFQLSRMTLLCSVGHSNKERAVAAVFEEAVLSD